MFSFTTQRHKISAKSRDVALRNCGEQKIHNQLKPGLDCRLLCSRSISNMILFLDIPSILYISATINEPIMWQLATCNNNFPKWGQWGLDSRVSVDDASVV